MISSLLSQSNINELCDDREYELYVDDISGIFAFITNDDDIDDDEEDE
eukprot:CAMPEP_0201575290 /NCGR_PEP_ID=MMETSP0190_2-20130828/20399_1 /ASSEMBLY_ACC=CAM_ASM_000263 /TAXON_ID=37353 /ORGANISM="Rosalina sp." /LENGTH=47 /DNA_ID= /DNA_START= /DNA_END= /DNA_ORIENTATION=